MDFRLHCHLHKALILILFFFFFFFCFFPSPLTSSPIPIDLNNSAAANFTLDFGRIFDNEPRSVLKPTTVQDISTLLKSTTNSSADNNITIAPRGVGHSTYGQAQALGGIVVDMPSLPSSIRVEKAHVDAGAGALWIDVLNETLKQGLTPRSWTDYLYLTVGGTLSVGGISGQTFKYGPQISNVIELDVVTGKGEYVTCSKEKNSPLFYGALGGLGQFGIITRARIIVHPAPKMVKSIVASYHDFDQFRRDQELLISDAKVDYVEGLLEFQDKNGTVSTEKQPFYSIEIAIYYNDEGAVQETLNQVLSQLKFVKSTLKVTSMPYYDFLNRVRAEELELRRRGLWEVAHPWTNFFVPRVQIERFTDLLVATISDTFTAGLIKIYPIRRNKWDSNMSAMLPEINQEDDIFYTVSVLQSAPPSCKSGTQCLDTLLSKNQKVLDTATLKPETGMGAKQYLAYWKNEEEWKTHFGGTWERFKNLKETFDPLHILTPGQRIFARK